MNGMDIGRLLILGGTILIVLGGVVMLLSRFTSLDHLPGDIFIKGEHGSFYFPVISCIVVSIILSVILNLFHR